MKGTFNQQLALWSLIKSTPFSVVISYALPPITGFIASCKS